MTRIPSLASSVFAASLAVLPMGAFAQQTAAPAAVTPHSAAPAQTVDTGAKTAVTGTTVPVSKPEHARLISPAHPAPAKAVEPGKS